MLPIRLLIAITFALTLAACGASRIEEAPTRSDPRYDAIVDDAFFIEQVDARYLTPENVRTEVDYFGPEKPGAIVVDVFARRLYHVHEGGRATRYGIAVGREGLSFKGTGYIGRKAEWPRWQPTRNMLRREPDVYGPFAAGVEGGLENPLGARALYLYRNGRDTYFRIHGTIDPASIGRATSAGCIRLFNQDAIHLYEQVDTGAFVKVRTLNESLELEGPFIDDAYGRIVPDTEENRARRAAQSAEIAASGQIPELAG